MPPMSKSPANLNNMESNPKDFQESESSSSEDEIKICRSQPCGVPVSSHETSDSSSDLESWSETREMAGLWENNSQWIPASEESLDPEEKEQLRCRNAIAEMLKDLKAGKVPHDNSPETSTDQGLNQLNYKTSLTFEGL